MANDVQQGSVIGKAAVESLGGKKIAIIDDKTAYGAGLADETEKAAKAAGATIVAREYTNDKATDFKAILTKIKAKNPDVIMYGGMDAQGGPMVKQMKELGHQGEVHRRRRRVLVRVAQARGRRGRRPVLHPGRPAAGQDAETPQDFVTRFTAKYGPIQVYAPYSYDAANSLIGAMEKANSTDPAKYLPELASLNLRRHHRDDRVRRARRHQERRHHALPGQGRQALTPMAVNVAGKTEKIEAAASAAPAMAPAEPKKDEMKKDEMKKDDMKKDEKK